MTPNSPQKNNDLLSSVTEGDWARLDAMADELAIEIESHPPDLSLEIETDIESVRYSACLDVYRGEGDEPDEHLLRSEFGYFSPVLAKGLSTDELRAWVIQTLHECHSTVREQSTPRGQARMQVYMIMRESGLIDDATADALSRRIMDEFVMLKPRIGVRAATEPLAS